MRLVRVVIWQGLNTALTVLIAIRWRMAGVKVLFKCLFNSYFMLKYCMHISIPSPFPTYIHL